MALFAYFISFKHGEHYATVGDEKKIHGLLSDVISEEFESLENSGELSSHLIPEFYSLLLSKHNETITAPLVVNAETVLGHFVTIQKIEHVGNYLLHVDNFYHSNGENFVFDNDSDVLSKLSQYGIDASDADAILSGTNDDGCYFEIPNTSLWGSLFALSSDEE